jgi:hypothetical protein
MMSLPMQSMRALRIIERCASSDHVGPILAAGSADLVLCLLNEHRTYLHSIEKKWTTTIHLTIDKEDASESFRIISPMVSPVVSTMVSPVVSTMVGPVAAPEALPPVTEKKRHKKAHKGSGIQQKSSITPPVTPPVIQSDSQSAHPPISPKTLAPSRPMLKDDNFGSGSVILLPTASKQRPVKYQGKHTHNKARTIDNDKNRQKAQQNQQNSHKHQDTPPIAHPIAPPDLTAIPSVSDLIMPDTGTANKAAVLKTPPLDLNAQGQPSEQAVAKKRKKRKPSAKDALGATRTQGEVLVNIAKPAGTGEPDPIKPVSSGPKSSVQMPSSPKPSVQRPIKKQGAKGPESRIAATAPSATGNRNDGLHPPVTGTPASTASITGGAAVGVSAGGSSGGTAGSSVGVSAGGATGGTTELAASKSRRRNRSKDRGKTAISGQNSTATGVSAGDLTAPEQMGVKNKQPAIQEQRSLGVKSVKKGVTNGAEPSAPGKKPKELASPASTSVSGPLGIVALPPFSKTQQKPAPKKHPAHGGTAHSKTHPNHVGGAAHSSGKSHRKPGTTSANDGIVLLPARPKST